ncbi:OmpA family protein [Montanilutibacter psychrotolerans]|uniref:OmpA-like domain-containing protein n=1 Tax=Montanilutibacter psychrotolerans TaxID=1327343 RepID=A0A3M8T406_9GAMM|nr:OmpA family protein [Lysobacter psychrotolerans]RNF86204.1 hypothetical protein EER27_01925 [Lysobacter psychrotolerans]
MYSRRPRNSESQAETEPAPPPGTGNAVGMPQFLRENEGAESETGMDAGTGMDASTGMDAGVTDAAPAEAGPTDAGVPAGVGPALPTGPNACTTVEEEERKSRFGARSFSALDFRPSAGYGKFDAYYWPDVSLMAAIVKMKFNYVQADNTPTLNVLMQMAMAGQDISQFFWTEAEKTQFATDYVQRVSSQWSFAHTFRSTKACWPFTARPHVTPRVVDDVADAHFNVTVHKTNTFRGSAFRARNPGTPGWQGTGDLDSLDTTDLNNRMSTDVARSERQRLERAVASATASPVQFARGSDTVEAADRARLLTLADAMKAKNPSDPAVPMVLNGFASAEGGATDNRTLSLRRAEAVASELRAAGVPQPMVIAGLGPTGAPNDAANRKVELAPSTTFEGTYTGNRFAPDAHEFGHALGMPDEYDNHTTGLLGDKQTAFVQLAQAAGVAPPDQWGDRTSSVMANGVDVLPRHYLTIWEALGSMTAPDITRNEWSID